jgi:hypothetical protein
MRVQLRMNYEMNRQLQADSNLSLSYYDVLVALSGINLNLNSSLPPAPG